MRRSRRPPSSSVGCAVTTCGRSDPMWPTGAGGAVGGAPQGRDARRLPWHMVVLRRPAESTSRVPVLGRHAGLDRPARRQAAIFEVAQGVPSGPLIRFFVACVEPVLGDKTPRAGIADIIDREKKARAKGEADKRSGVAYGVLNSEKIFQNPICQCASSELYPPSTEVDHADTGTSAHCTNAGI